MKGMSKFDIFSGGYEENISELFEKYEALSDMAELFPDQMFKGMNMLFGETALTFFLNTVRTQVNNCSNKYAEAVTLMTKEYTLVYQKERLLDEWRTVDIVEWFKRYPEKSQIEVFRLCFNRLMRIQRQLDEKYQDDIFLRDQIVSSIS